MEISKYLPFFFFCFHPTIKMVGFLAENHKNPSGKWKNNSEKQYLLEIKIYHMGTKGQLTILWLDDRREPYNYFATMEKDKKKK